MDDTYEVCWYEKNIHKYRLIKVRSNADLSQLIRTANTFKRRIISIKNVSI
jgi:hypothetical protein